jgi:hypothetical protein
LLASLTFSETLPATGGVCVCAVFPSLWDETAREVSERQNVPGEGLRERFEQ